MSDADRDARPGLRNPRKRVVLRDLDATRPNEAAHIVRDRIYRALHRGARCQWCA